LSPQVWVLCLFCLHAEGETKSSYKTVLKVETLSLNSSPGQEARFVEDKQTELKEGISWVRQSAVPYTSWCQDVFTKTKPKVETAVAFKTDLQISKRCTTWILSQTGSDWTCWNCWLSYCKRFKNKENNISSGGLWELGPPSITPNRQPQL
ncbi:unnamed protein product, partial [Staurois parvus]